MHTRNTSLNTLPEGMLWHGFVWRRAVSMVSVFFLILQLVAPSLANAANGEWIEICSEYGVEVLQIDLSQEDIGSSESRTDCKDCTFCAFSAPMEPPAGPQYLLTVSEPQQLDRWVEFQHILADRHIWPESRGPPTQKNHSNNTERDFPVSLALTPNKGGALWI